MNYDMKPWKFLQLLLLPLAVIVGNYLGGWYNYILPAICFVIRPLYSLSIRHSGEASHHEHEINPSPAYRYVALTFVPVLPAVTALSFFRISASPFNPVEFTGLVLSTGTMNGIIGFTLAHEFIHRFNITDRIAGHLLLLQNNYLHYSIEHIGGHHVYACTPKDPHTARLNESFYRFLPRAIFYTFINACEIEARRLNRKHYPVFGFQNKILLFIILQMTVAAIAIIVGGWVAFLFLLLQSLVAACLLHITNYLQHYGLMRNEIGPGQYEKVNPHHAWSSPDSGNGLSLFQLENHADHHIHPNRPYEQLTNHEESPVQPAGYSGMLMLALIPPLWFRIMNKRVNSFTISAALSEI
jgi:alkane 1-monooxygenase